MRSIKYIVIHHSAGGKAETVKTVDTFHRTKNWGTAKEPIYAQKSALGWYVQYHYFIDRKGNFTQCKTSEEIGWHAGVWEVNKTSIGICVSGNFNIEKPTETQLKTLKTILQYLMKKYSIKIENVKFHRDFKKTDCPGKNMTIGIIKQLVG